MTIEKEAIEVLGKLVKSFEAAIKGPAGHIDLDVIEQAKLVLAKAEAEAKEQKELQPYRCAAMAQQKDGEIEVDEGAIVSLGDSGGAYVQAWFWVDEYDVFDDDPCEICNDIHDPLDFGLTWCGKCSELGVEATAQKRGDEYVCARCLELESALKARGEG